MVSYSSTIPQKPPQPPKRRTKKPKWIPQYTKQRRITTSGYYYVPSESYQFVNSTTMMDHDRTCTIPTYKPTAVSSSTTTTLPPPPPPQVVSSTQPNAAVVSIGGAVTPPPDENETHHLVVADTEKPPTAPKPKEPMVVDTVPTAPTTPTTIDTDTTKQPKTNEVVAVTKNDDVAVASTKPVTAVVVEEDDETNFDCLASSSVMSLPSSPTNSMQDLTISVPSSSSPIVSPSSTFSPTTTLPTSTTKVTPPKELSIPSPPLLSSTVSPSSTVIPKDVPKESIVKVLSKSTPTTVVSNESAVPETTIAQRQRGRRRTSTFGRKVQLRKERQSYDMNCVPRATVDVAFVKAWRNFSLKRTTSSKCLLEKSHKIPFLPNSKSMLWIPASRDHWMDCLDEMTSVCMAASFHRHLLEGKPKKEFSAPLSRAYIKERMDIDDPIYGYQIRHVDGGWLQGFVTLTTFTSWTHWFKWDSLYVSENGLPQAPTTIETKLAMELDQQERAGDPTDSGVVWPRVAELVLVGALGCGECLVQLALEKMATIGYTYAVLEATDSSRPFYEKLGFVRVGAIAKYGQLEEIVNGIQNDETKEVDPQGYRHWAPADLARDLVTQRGPPSCMMGRKIDGLKGQQEKHFVGCPCGCDGTKEWPFRGSFGDEFERYIIHDKPIIRPLGNPARGMKREASSVIAAPTSNVKYTRSSNGRRIIPSCRARDNFELMQQQPHPVSSTTSNSTAPATTTSIVSTRNSNTNKTILPKTTLLGNNNTTNTSITITSGVTPKRRSTVANSLLKQDIANMYRHPKTIYYYNKVVTPKQFNPAQHKSQYYFVLHYNESMQSMRLIPLFQSGTFSKGIRMGKPKWKARVLLRHAPANMNNRDEEKMSIQKYWESMNILVDGNCNEWDIVKSYMVTKCKSVSSESWDIL